MSDQTEQPEQPDDERVVYLTLPESEFVKVIKRTRKAMRKAKTVKEAARFGETAMMLMAGLAQGESNHEYRQRKAAMIVADNEKRLREYECMKAEQKEEQNELLRELNEKLEGRYKVVNDLLAKATNEVETLRKQQAAAKKAEKAKP